jgi:hypothetical protein
MIFSYISFNTVITNKMIMAIVQAEITSHTGLSAWLDKNGKDIQPIY